MPSRRPSRPLVRFWAIAFFLQAAVAQAEDAPVRSRMRHAVLDAFPYRPPADAPAPRAVPPPGSDGETDPEIVVLPQYDVSAQSARMERNLARAIERSRGSGPINESRFGTGVHERDLGKVRAGATTILFVPVHLKFSW